MDELTAYQILKLEPGSSTDEIKEAYSQLSKQFHPEEYPEEFQRIHDAYRTLTRRNRRARNTENIEPIPVKFPVEETIEAPVNNENYENNTNRECSYKEDEQDFYNFDETLNKANEAESAEIHEEVLRALAEIKVLMTPEYCNNKKLFEKYFKKEEYERAFSSPEYVGALSALIEESKLKKSIYTYIISFYRFKDKKRENLIPEGRALYDALNAKVNIKSTSSPVKTAIPAGVVAGLWAGLRTQAHISRVFGSILLFLVFLAVCVWIYKKCRDKNHSHAFSQVMVILFLNLFQFIACIFDFWVPVFGSADASIDFVVNILIISWIWLIILDLIVVIKKLRFLLTRK